MGDGILGDTPILRGRISGDNGLIINEKNFKNNNRWSCI